MKKNILNNNSGQVLLIVVVALAVTLGVGLGITSRNTASLKRTGNLDSFQKVTVAAEGALEKYLLKNDTDLDAMVNTVSPATPEEILFAESKTKAVVTVSKLKAGDTGMVYEKVKPSETVSFLTTEFSSLGPSTPASSVCLRFEALPANVTYMINVITSNPSPVTGLPYTNQTLPGYSYTLQQKNALADRQLSNSFRHETYLASGNSINTVATTCPNGYKFTNVTMVRIQPLSGELSQLTVKVVDVTSNVKNITQGYKISAVGRFSDSVDKTTRTVEAYKYLDTPSSIYDFAVFLDN